MSWELGNGRNQIFADVSTGIWYHFGVNGIIFRIRMSFFGQAHREFVVVIFYKLLVDKKNINT